MRPSLKNTFFESLLNYWKQGFQVLLLLVFGMGMGYGQTINIDSPSPVAEGDSGTSSIIFTVSIDASNPVSDITVDYQISGATKTGPGEP